MVNDGVIFFKGILVIVLLYYSWLMMVFKYYIYSIVDGVVC